MTTEHQIEILPSASRQVVRWDPADAASVEAARAEFARLREAGYALFAVEERAGSTVEFRTGAFEPGSGSFAARSPVPVQTDEFRPEASRIVAVRPMRGGCGPEARPPHAMASTRRRKSPTTSR